MEKLSIMLSELKVSESVETYQTSRLEVQNKTQEVLNLKQDEQNLFLEIRNQEKQFTSTINELEHLKKEYGDLLKLDEYEFGAFDRLSDLEHQIKIYGITVEACFRESTITQAKILFSEEMFVILNCDLIENKYDLQKIVPSHPQFEEMRGFLLESGDIAGFLCYVKCYFKKKEFLF
ncbi:uncharacterized protein LOC129911322 isoform X2 [Episyrphus balteatus]|uniref:uncharacterized protein LOC129911322 isoform X2 n=1 Tax=Episyrphus balteatus TaxID=286459 RepID=UPI0024850B01|nr:uncharacterized protein LOC129911322 isoform X2 [Episyrphus balteatus]